MGRSCPEGRGAQSVSPSDHDCRSRRPGERDEAPVVLAWQGERLVGVWPFIRGHSRSGAPMTVLKTPVHPTMANGTPVIDSAVAEPALSAMLDAIKSSAALPKILLGHLLQRRWSGDGRFAPRISVTRARASNSETRHTAVPRLSAGSSCIFRPGVIKQPAPETGSTSPAPGDARAHRAEGAPRSCCGQ